MSDKADSYAAAYAGRITRAVESIVRPLQGTLEQELAGMVQELATAMASERAAALEQAQREAAAEKEAAVRDALAAARAEHAAALGMAQASAEAALSIAVAEAVSGAESQAAATLVATRSEAERTLNARLAEAEARSANALEQAREAADADRAAAVRDALAAARAEHEAALTDAKQAAAAERDETLRMAQASAEAALSAAVAEAVSEAESQAAAALAAARSEAEQALNARLAEAEARSASALEQAREAAEAALSAAVAEAVSGARSQAAFELASARSEAERTLIERLAEVEARGATALAAARADADRTLIERLAEVEARSAGAVETSVTDALARERQADMASVSELLNTFRAMDQAQSMGEVLDALAGHVPVESGRVAVFLVREGRLSGWRFQGFPEVADPPGVELPLDESDVIKRAVKGHSCAATSDRNVETGALSPAPPGSLLALPAGRAGFAAPVCVGGQVVAVVYADEGGVDAPPVPSSWPEILELSARHASRCLELLMVARIAPWTTPASSGVGEARPPGPYTGAEARGGEDEDAARRYARLLISEIKLYHESDVNTGKRERDLLKRLRPEIDRARRLYEERIPPTVRARADCFDQELVRTLADGNAGLLGQAT